LWPDLKNAAATFQLTEGLAWHISVFGPKLTSPGALLQLTDIACQRRGLAQEAQVGAIRMSEAGAQTRGRHRRPWLALAGTAAALAVLALIAQQRQRSPQPVATAAADGWTLDTKDAILSAAVAPATGTVALALRDTPRILLYSPEERDINVVVLPERITPGGRKMDQYSASHWPSPIAFSDDGQEVAIAAPVSDMLYRIGVRSGIVTQQVHLPHVYYQVFGYEPGTKRIVLGEIDLGEPRLTSYGDGPAASEPELVLGPLSDADPQSGESAFVTWWHGAFRDGFCLLARTSAESKWQPAPDGPTMDVPRAVLIGAADQIAVLWGNEAWLNVHDARTLTLTEQLRLPELDRRLFWALRPRTGPGPYPEVSVSHRLHLAVWFGGQTDAVLMSLRDWQYMTLHTQARQVLIDERRRSLVEVFPRAVKWRAMPAYALRWSQDGQRTRLNEE